MDSFNFDNSIESEASEKERSSNTIGTNNTINT